MNIFQYILVGSIFALYTTICFFVGNIMFHSYKRQHLVNPFSKWSMVGIATLSIPLIVFWPLTLLAGWIAIKRKRMNMNKDSKMVLNIIIGTTFAYIAGPISLSKYWWVTIILIAFSQLFIYFSYEKYKD